MKRLTNILLLGVSLVCAPLFSEAEEFISTVSTSETAVVSSGTSEGQGHAENLESKSDVSSSNTSVAGTVGIWVRDHIKCTHDLLERFRGGAARKVGMSEDGVLFNCLFVALGLLVLYVIWIILGCCHATELSHMRQWSWVRRASAVSGFGFVAMLWDKSLDPGDMLLIPVGLQILVQIAAFCYARHLRQTHYIKHSFLVLLDYVYGIFLVSCLYFLVMALVIAIGIGILYIISRVLGGDRPSAQRRRAVKWKCNECGYVFYSQDRRNCPRCNSKDVY